MDYKFLYNLELFCHSGLDLVFNSYTHFLVPGGKEKEYSFGIYFVIFMCENHLLIS